VDTNFFVVRSFDHACYYETRLILVAVAVGMAAYRALRGRNYRYLVMFCSGVFFFCSLHLGAGALFAAQHEVAMDQQISKPIRQFILSHSVARLATADKGGQPHVIPFCYAFDGARFYFVVDEKPKRQTGKPLKRVRNILENPQVALVIDDYADDWTQLAYVLVSGTAALVEDQEEYARALVLLRDRYPQYRLMNLTFARNPMVRITPTKVHTWGKVVKE
jgi:PPOX class probable F420-dependent enzyme